MKFRIGAALLLGYALSVSAALAQAQDAAVVSATSGTVVVQKADGSVRSLAPGSAVHSGDVITTQPNSSARLKFTDGGELAVSSNSQIKIDSYSFNTAAPGTDNLVMNLVRGGLRSITGLISRRGNQDAYRLKAATATIGIRGTDYVARLCGEDCAKDVARAPYGVRPITPDIVARVALLSGQAVAIDKTGKSRPLNVGSAVYQGDIVETRGQSHALLVFLDEGRVTVQPDTRLAVEQFRYEPARPEPGVSVMRLFQGSLRAVTGLLAKRHPQGYRVETLTATIGIRGTGFDVSCQGTCKGDPERQDATAKPESPSSPFDAAGGLFVHTWEGEVEVRNPAGAQTAGVGQTVQVSARDRAPVLVPEAPQFMRDAPGPRPDGIQIDLQQLL
ncbi:MAG: FecR domain-containing protein, partial [Acidobacteriota bacterium]